MQYGKLILNALLDSYERSAISRKAAGEGGAGSGLGAGGRATGEEREEGFLPQEKAGSGEMGALSKTCPAAPEIPGRAGEAGRAAANRRIWFHVNRKTLPGYFDDTSARPRKEINESCLALARRGLIEIRWVKHEEGNLIAKVALNTGALDECYRFLGRRPRTAAAAEAISLACRYAGGAPAWAVSFFEFVAERLEQGESVARYLDIEDTARVELLFRALREAARLSEETPRRVFSLRALGHSKAFDSVAGTVARAVRDFHPAFRDGGGEDSLDQKEILAELGLVENPQHLFLGGPLVFTANGRRIDVSAFSPDLGLPAGMVPGMEIEELDAEAVITIENLTSYHQFVRRSGGRFLAVYLGGYHNTARRRLLVKLREHAAGAGKRVRFYHWGDIDYGGFTIFQHLREKCGLDLAPLHMDVATLERYEKYALPLERAYAAKLRRLLEREEYGIFHGVIRCMLEKNMRLEQECVEVDLSAL
ncbi:MAG: DUF2220 domain-containing protein [Firmicutes bacterium]|nr:DUF2220 domain-containing protein [Bacillota bacterium]